jgi:hypothetical protein
MLVVSSDVPLTGQLPGGMGLKIGCLAFRRAAAAAWNCVQQIMEKRE